MNTYIAVLLACSVAVSYPFLRGFLRKQTVSAKVETPVRRGKRSAGRRVIIARSEQAPEPKKTRSSFRAASVHGLPDCSQAAKEMEGKRYLLDELPTLPLEACDQLAECKCSFTNHSDRRKKENRRGDRTAFDKTGADGDAGTNRRSGLDRRSGLSDEFQDIEYE